MHTAHLASATCSLRADRLIHSVCENMDHHERKEAIAARDSNMIYGMPFFVDAYTDASRAVMPLHVSLCVFV